MCITSNKKKGDKTLDPRKSCEIQKGAGKASRQSSTSPTIFLYVYTCIYVQRTEKQGSEIQKQELNKDNERTEIEDGEKESERQRRTARIPARDLRLVDQSSGRLFRWPNPRPNMAATRETKLKLRGLG